MMKTLIIVGIVLGIGIILIASLSALSEIRTQECKAWGGVMTGPFGCVTSHADPFTAYDVDVDCNNMDGRTEAQCFKDAFESCTTAVTHDVIYTIEGDAMYLIAIIQEDCKINIKFDNSGDTFGGSDKGISFDVCNSIELEEKHMWIIGDCANKSQPEFQINYQAQDFASDERCRTIDGKWSYESHNCVYDPNEFDCEAAGGFQGCMTREQIGDRRDVCNIVCEFEPMDRK